MQPRRGDSSSTAASMPKPAPSQSTACLTQGSSSAPSLVRSSFSAAGATSPAPFLPLSILRHVDLHRLDRLRPHRPDAEVVAVVGLRHVLVPHLDHLPG